jgi:hypothetical protein
MSALTTKWKMKPGSHTSHIHLIDLKIWRKRAYRAGRHCGYRFRNDAEGVIPAKMAMNRDWNHWVSKHPRSLSEKLNEHASRMFFRGFCSKAGINYIRLIPIPTNKKVAAILNVRDGVDTVFKVLDVMQRLPFYEIIVVVSGLNDDNFEQIKNHPVLPILLHYEEELGYDAGRSIGAKVSQSDILLFLDGNTIIPAKKLLPFIKSIEHGADVALNDFSPFIDSFHRRDTVSIFKEFVNEAMGRPDLKTNSLTALPHALSRAAAETIGLGSLSIPPLAQTIAIHNRLKFTVPASINILKLKRATNINYLTDPAFTNLMIGDHLEALHEAMSHQGKRLRFKDKIRKRHLAAT